MDVDEFANMLYKRLLHIIIRDALDSAANDPDYASFKLLMISEVLIL